MHQQRKLGLRELRESDSIARIVQKTWFSAFMDSPVSPDGRKDGRAPVPDQATQNESQARRKFYAAKYDFRGTSADAHILWWQKPTGNLSGDSAFSIYIIP